MSLTLAERLKNLRDQLPQALATVHGIQGAIAVLEEIVREEQVAVPAPTDAPTGGAKAIPS